MTQAAAPTRRRAATREKLLDAARILLAREGIQGASVEQICEEAGFTRGAFYSNFSSKDELVLALFEREREQMQAMLQRAADPAVFEGLGPISAVALIMERFVDLQPADADWFCVHAEFAIRGVRDEEVGRAFNAAWRAVKAQIEELIEQVLGILGLRLMIPVGHAATIVMGGYDAALREALTENRGLDLELLQATMPMIMLSVTERLD